MAGDREVAAMREAERRVEAAKKAATESDAGLEPYSLLWWAFIVGYLQSSIQGLILDLEHVQREAREDIREAEARAADEAREAASWGCE